MDVKRRIILLNFWFRSSAESPAADGYQSGVPYDQTEESDAAEFAEDSAPDLPVWNQWEHQERKSNLDIHVSYKLIWS